MKKVSISVFALAIVFALSSAFTSKQTTFDPAEGWNLFGVSISDQAVPPTGTIYSDDVEAALNLIHITAEPAQQTRFDMEDKGDTYCSFNTAQYLCLVQLFYESGAVVDNDTEQILPDDFVYGEFQE